MIDYKGIWLPDGERHLPEWMDKVNYLVDGKPTYQYHKQLAAMRYCSQFRTAVDIGAHVGLWSMHLAKRFRTVLAFEPVEAHRACFRLNVPEPHVTLYPYALGETEQLVSISSKPTSSGNSYVSGNGAIRMLWLDYFNLQEVDFIKSDCEGYDLLALRGGQETITRCRPTIIVEQKPGLAQGYGLDETGAVPFLLGLGAELRETISGDYIFTFA